MCTCHCLGVQTAAAPCELGLQRVARTHSRRIPPTPCPAVAHLHMQPTHRLALAQVPDKNVSPVVVCPWSDTAATLLSYTQVLAALPLPDPALAWCLFPRVR